MKNMGCYTLYFWSFLKTNLYALMSVLESFQAFFFCLKAIYSYTLVMVPLILG